MTYQHHPLSIAYRLYLSVVLALVIDSWVTIEWTWPNCGEGDRWLAAHGLPLPYTRWGGWSSMEYVWVPELFALNMVLLAGAAFLALRWLPAFRFSSALYGALTVLLTLNAVVGLLITSIMMVQADRSLAHEGSGYSMWDLRPVAMHFDGSRAYDCTPAPWWFGEQPRNSGFPVRREPATSFP
jgi:hypothetical protein